MDKNIFKINIESTIREALELINLNKNGAIFVEKMDSIVGIITDGDIRRSLLKDVTIDEKINSIINSKFVYLLEEQATRENILKLLDNKIKLIPILDKSKKLVSIVTEKNIDWNEDEQVISKAKSPLRISFAGGGTDLTTYYYMEEGVVLNATINKFCHCILEKRADCKVSIHSYDLNAKLLSSSIDKLKYDGKLDLIISIIKILKPDYGFNLTTYSDVKPGTGLGGSAVLVSSIIGAFNNFRENKYTDYEIAELAFHAERVCLNISGGWQDQYATVFGGFNYIEFKGSENIVNTLRISNDIKNELEDSLLLCNTNIVHNSNDIHDDQKKQMNNKKQKEYANIAKTIANKMKSRILKGKLDDFGKLLHSAWETKKKFSKNITNKNLDSIYNYAIKSGALGGKLLGAGNGGYFIFYVPTFNKIDFIDKMNKKNLVLESFTFDNYGLRSWITKKKNNV